MKYSSQDSRSPYWRSNPRHPQYETGILTAWLRHYV